MLILLNIKTLIKNNKTMFYLIFIIFFVSSVGVIYIYNYYTLTETKNSVYFEKQRLYTIECGSEKIDEKLQFLVKKYSANLQRVYAYFNNESDAIIVNYFGEAAAKNKVIFGNYLSDNNKEIIVPQYNSSSNKTNKNLDDYYNIKDESFKVVGIGFTSQYEISYEKLNNKSLIQGVAIITNSFFTQSEKKQFSTEMKDIFDSEYVNFPAESSNNPDSLLDWIIVFGLAFLGILNISFVYVSILEKRKKQQAVFYMLGCKKLHLYALYISEMLIISTIFYLLSVVFTRCILFSILVKINTEFVFVLGVNNICYLYSVFVIIMLVLFVIQSLKFFVKTPYEIKRG